ncbi:MAG: hypothetical protein ACI9H8_001858 [Lysobacterales bacterium]|jgi:hypothetical protein
MPSERVTLPVLFFIGILTMSFKANAQGLPLTSIWLTEIDDGIASELTLISSAERYNNQPMFSLDGRTVYFTAEQTDGQTDIARFDVESRSLSLVNHSPESEYSPTPVPGLDVVSVIRVELPDQLQRLWSISVSSGEAKLLMPNVEPVGYQSWLDSETVAVFILGDSFTLHKATVGDQPSQLLATNVGRTLRKHPQTGHILFVDKNSEPWSIASFDAENMVQTKVMDLFPGIEDFEVDSSGGYWMGSGSKLYRRAANESSWALNADFQEFGIANITRLASSPDGDYLAIVGSR